MQQILKYEMRGQQFSQHSQSKNGSLIDIKDLKGSVYQNTMVREQFSDLPTHVRNQDSEAEDRRSFNDSFEEPNDLERNPSRQKSMADST